MVIILWEQEYFFISVRLCHLCFLLAFFIDAVKEMGTNYENLQSNRMPKDRRQNVYVEKELQRAWKTIAQDHFKRVEGSLAA